MDALVAKSFAWGESDPKRKMAMTILQGMLTESTIRLATKQEDMNDSSDLVITKNGKDYGVGMRFRQWKYANHRDLTIRASLQSDHDTEFQKIKRGKCRIYFYAWYNYDTNWLKYMVIDMDKFRETIIDEPDDKRFNTGGNQYTDTGFYCYNYKSLKKAGCIIKTNLT